MNRVDAGNNEIKNKKYIGFKCREKLKYHSGSLKVDNVPEKGDPQRGQAGLSS